MKSLRLKLTLLISAIVAISVVVVGGIVVTTITNDLREESQMSILTQGEELDRLMKNTGDELDQMHETLYAGYDTLIKEQVDTVLSILQYYYDLSQSGMLTTEEAKEQAKDVIRAMRFGENGYFWIDNTDYILQVHPFSVATEGKSRKDTADPNGKLIIQEFIKTKNTGGGYTDYVWTKPEEDGLFPKRAYTGYFEPWEWVPGTGAYTDEIEDEFMTHVAETIASFQSQVMTLSSEYMVIAIQDDNTINHYTDPSQIGQVLTLTDAKTGGSIADLIKNSVGQYVNYSVEDPETGKVRMMLGYTFRNTVTQQYVMVAQNSEDVFASANKLQYTIIIVGLFVTLIAALLSYFAAGIVSKPIVKLKEISGLVSQGDLTVQSQFRGKDEVGQLSESFNAMIMNLRTMSQDSMQIAQSLDFSTENLSEMIDQSTKAIEQISVTIDEIAMGASAQAGETQVGVTKTDGLNNSSSEIKNSMEEMMSSVGEMRKMSDDGSDAMTDLSTKQQSNEASINKINDVMALLGEQMKTIDNFTAVIMNISQQTNLLSLNASIEAARAGEHGKGFAVVADEIRKLAEESNRSANEIKDVVARIQQDTEDAILVANEANEVTKEQNASVVNTQAIFNDLKSTISATVSKIEGVYGNIEQLVKDNQDVGYIMDNIHAITEGTAAASEEVAASVEEQNASMEEINSHIMTLTQEAKNLRDNMSQYKL